MPKRPPYLAPYLDAVRQHGAAFPSLLWASPSTQAARFDAILRLRDLKGQSVLDVGCGRADLLDFLVARHAEPADYIGIEAVEELANAAEGKRHPGSTILRADFVTEPLRLFVGADVIVFSGSLNTVDDAAFYPALRAAFDATAECVVFNFLCSSLLSAREYLHWRRTDDVVNFCRSLTGDIRVLSDYLEGDCTIALAKPATA